MKHSKFTLTLDLGSTLTRECVASKLRETAKDILEEMWDCDKASIRNINGNRIGKWEFYNDVIEIECDYQDHYFNERLTKEGTLYTSVKLSSEQIQQFNKKYGHNKYYLSHQKGNKYWLVKIDPNEDPSQNFGPFANEKEVVEVFQKLSDFSS